VVRRIAAALSALAVWAGFAVAVAPGAAAHNDLYGYFNCTQAGKLVSADVRVGFTNLPTNGTGDGVVNSLRDRLADATAALDLKLSANNPFGRGLTFVGQASASNPANISIRIASLDTGLLGIARLAESGCAVAVHATPKYYLASNVYVDMATRGDWFTQDNSRRAYWEGCPGRGFVTTYTCSKTIDFGSVVLHELGHAIGLAHPADVDTHLGGGSQSFSLAKCSNVLDQATMCQAGNVGGTQYQYRTHRRTLDPWDVTSIAQHY
jgi:hypothetical protein